ncbi:MAG: NRDE family protein [Reichenbachiella sp.]
MCLIIFSWKNHAQYDLIVASNRDEFLNRPTEPAHFWEDYPNTLAGRDLKSGGTWMGLTKGKRFAALTNFRDFDRINENAPSRGHLVSDFLNSDVEPENYINTIKSSISEFNPFNILIGNEKELWYFNNINFEIKKLIPGLYGLSNGLLNEPWPKVLKGKESMKSMLEKAEFNNEEIFKFMQDKELALDKDLPKTGVPYGMEKGLSSLFIELPSYGTRCSTLIFSGKNETQFIEKTYKLDNQTPGTVSHQF